MQSPGLSPAEVAASRTAHGSNILTPPPRESLWRQYFKKFDDPVIRVLLIAALLATAVGAAEGHFAEGIGILIAVLLATGLAFLNEYRAAKAFDILNRSSDDTSVTVRRDGNYTTIPRRDVVVGDLVLVETGAEIPADGRLIEAVSLQVSEARLTGESRPVEKHINDGSGDEAYSADRLLRSCTVVDGHGLFEVTAVGDSTEIGRTARAAAEETEENTPLNRQLHRLSKWIGVVGLGVAALTFVALLVRDILMGSLVLSPPQWSIVGVFGLAALVAMVRVWLPIVYDGFELTGIASASPAWLKAEGPRGWLIALAVAALVALSGSAVGWFGGYWPAQVGDWITTAAARDLLEIFMVAVTIVVVAVPEGLAMSVTLSLAYSMRKMAASNNLVRRLHACETIGSATVICTDKTGTLTRNEMRVAHTALDASDAIVAEAIAANTTAQLDRSGETVQPVGNPTEGALLMWLSDRGLDYGPVRTAFCIIHQWTFTTERKFMATRGTSPALGRSVLHAKGAPEVIIARTTLPADEQARILAEIQTYQKRGMRTLGLAYRADPAGTDLNEMGREMTWLGYVAIDDPVRDEVPDAIAACRGAGVGIKIVTGDTAVTAAEIGRQIGLLGDNEPPGTTLTGPEFAALDDAAASDAAHRLKVLARAKPADKLRLVRLLQKRGEVVAVTGDGVNDGPALNYADVGLAMGLTGSAVAKEASDIILLDDSFRSIVNAVMWGRSLYENIQRFVVFQLTINATALGLAFLGPFLGFRLPLTVMQMLWVNLIMDTFAALALATEPPNPAVLNRPPRDPKAFIVTPEIGRWIMLGAAVFLAVLITLIKWLGARGMIEEENVPSYGGTVLFCVFVLLQFWNLFNARRLGSTRSAFVGLSTNWLFTGIAGVILVGQILLVHLGGTVFRTVPLDLKTWGLIIGGTSTVLIAGEVMRAWQRWAGRAMPAGPSQP
jgi:Ca2+-transporting ATPase